MIHRGSQTITTERLVIRRFQQGDADAMFRNWCNDEQVSRYMSWEPHGTIKETERVLAEWVGAYVNSAYYHWGIEIGGELVGSIGAHNVNSTLRSCEVGYALSRDWWNQGIMTEALLALIDYLFETGFNRVAAIHRVENPASGRVMEKAGMQFEGTIRQIIIDNTGNFHDAKQYAIVARDTRPQLYGGKS